MKKISKFLGATSTLFFCVLLSSCISVDLTKSKQSDGKTNNSSTTTAIEESCSSDSDKSINEEIKVSIDEAIKFYRKDYPNTDISSLELKTFTGEYYYEIQGIGDSVEYEVKINASSGELKKVSEEPLDSDEQKGSERNSEKISLSDILSIEKVSQIAEQSVGGGQTIGWSLDREDATTFWEVSVKKDFKEIQIKINAKSGEILRKEVED